MLLILSITGKMSVTESPYSDYFYLYYEQIVTRGFLLFADYEVEHNYISVLGKKQFLRP